MMNSFQKNTITFEFRYDRNKHKMSCNIYLNKTYLQRNTAKSQICFYPNVILESIAKYKEKLEEKISYKYISV